jgi:hypothetical protein
MAERDRRADYEDDEEPEVEDIRRVAIWAACAVVAIGVTILAARSDRGAERLANAWAGLANYAVALLPQQPKPAAEASKTEQTDKEVKRLNETLQILAADRDRLLARLDSLERRTAATGSIPSETPSAPAPEGPPPLPQPMTIPPTPSAPAATPPASTPAPDWAATKRNAESLSAGDPSAVGSVATTTEFGVDIGGGQSVEVLRALWGSLRDRFSAQLTGLRPVVAVRETGKPGGLELRLVAGPVSNAVAAARLCGTLTAAGLRCQPAVFDGQRLAVH